MSNLAEITFSAGLQAHEAAWFVTNRSITSIDRHDQFELLKDLQMLKDSCVDTHIYLLFRCTGNNISHSDDTLRL